MNSAFMRLSSHEPILESVIDAMKASLSTVGYYSLLGRFMDTVEQYCLKNCPDTYNISLKKNLQVDLLCCNIKILGKNIFSYDISLCFYSSFFWVIFPFIVYFSRSRHAPC